jgi:UDP-N-acetyl-D-mannosaminuronic acid dehydrogenase
VAESCRARGGRESMKLGVQKIVIIGGCGHAGLPLGIKLARAGAETVLLDVDERAVAAVNAGRMPFLERGGATELRAGLRRGLEATTEPSVCARADVVIFVTSTDVDEHLNAKLSDLLGVFDQYSRYLTAKTLVVMRSTLFPGTMEYLYRELKRRGIRAGLAFCPERVSQGHALEEIDSLPQIISAFDARSFQRATRIFSALAPEIIKLSPLEAELAKLMTNSWRYIEFAIANQFYLIAEGNGVNFHKIYRAIRYNYPRAEGYKAPGFAAGPCLLKDTLQLASFFDHDFRLGHAAMLVNEGLATFVVKRAAALMGGSLRRKQVGLLGMTFKADSDDVRESLSYRVKKGLEFAGATVHWHDPYLEDSADLGAVIRRSQLLILTTPHREYRALKLTKPLIDVWGMYDNPQLEILPGTRKCRRRRPKAPRR